MLLEDDIQFVSQFEVSFLNKTELKEEERIWNLLIFISFQRLT